MESIEKLLTRKINIREFARSNMGTDEDPLGFSCEYNLYKQIAEIYCDKIQKLKTLKFQSGHSKLESKKKLGQFVVIIKKAMRKVLHSTWGWYINPILEQQNKFNLEVFQYLSLLRDAFEQLAEDKKRYDHIAETMHINFDVSLLRDTPPIDYLDFENKFRGPSENIKKIHSHYLEFFKEAPNGKVIDIGCGRGEFLELLGENGIRSKGLDTYEPFIDLCRQKGLSVELSDGLTYLAGEENCSISGVFMSHVAEHLDIKYLIALVHTAYDKLRPGGHFIIETPNPDCMAALSEFYIDFNHMKPLPYPLLEYFFSQAGYGKVIKYHAPETRYPLQMEKIRGEGVLNQKEFNDGVDLLNNRLFGYRDYTLIAKK